ncbi:MAG: sulfotransferase [Candidatus Marinimicrobia bacterium]|nr:sulfotransferase [Candidatus Neomarinimicrobiota bacterium]
MDKSSEQQSDFNNLVFIVGVGRSGTSLLQAMLNTHSKIAFLPEINFLRRFLMTNALEVLRKGKGEQALKQLLLSDRWLTRLGLDLSEILGKIEFDGQPVSLAIYSKILRTWLAKEKKVIIGDKDPRSIEFLPQLHRLFPEASVIHLYRDPRDVLLSRKKAQWSKNRSIYNHLFVNTVQLKLAHRQIKIFGCRAIEVAYEQLTTSTEEVLRSICTLLNVDYESGMLDFTESARKLVSADEMQWKKETLAPLTGSSVGRWEKDLTAWEVALVEKNVCAAFSHYDYSVSNPSIGLVKRVLAGGVSIVVAVASSIYVWWSSRNP